MWTSKQHTTAISFQEILSSNNLLFILFKDTPPLFLQSTPLQHMLTRWLCLRSFVRSGLVEVATRLHSPQMAAQWQAEGLATSPDGRFFFFTLPVPWSPTAAAAATGGTLVTLIHQPSQKKAPKSPDQKSKTHKTHKSLTRDLGSASWKHTERPIKVGTHTHGCGCRLQTKYCKQLKSTALEITEL